MRQAPLFVRYVLQVLPTAVGLWLAFVYQNYSVSWWYGIGLWQTGLSAAAALGFAAPVLLVNSRARPWAAGALLLVGHFAIFGDITYFRYCVDLLSIRSLAYGRQLVDVAASPMALLRLRDLVLLATVVAALWGTRKLALRWPDFPDFPARLATTLLIAAVGFGAVGSGIRYLDRFSEVPLGLNQLWDRKELASLIGVVSCHLVEVAQLIAVFAAPRPSAAEVLEVRTWLSERVAAQRPTPQTGLAAGCNVIVVQLESLNAFPVGLRVRGVAVTPHLDALKREMRFYPHLYTQTQGGVTSDAEFMTATSLYPLPSGATFVRTGLNRFPTALPHMLAERGYHTVVMNGFLDRTFWNRAQMYDSLGFAAFYDDWSYGNGPQLGPGLADGPFLERSLAKLKALPKPYYAMLITMSTHHPWTDFDDAGPHAFDQLGDPAVTRYLKSVHYLDAQLGHFVQGLKTQGQWACSVVVMYGDHPGIWADRPALTALLGPLDSPVALRNLRSTPLFVHAPGDRDVGEQRVAVGQMDIMPTVANLLGIPVVTALGRPVDTPEARLVAFRDGSYIYDRTLHDPKSGCDWSLDTKRTTAAPPSYVAAEITRPFTYSDMILTADLLPEVSP